MTTLTKTNTVNERLPSLDGMRGLAAMLVVLAHAGGSVGWPGWFWLDQLRGTLTGFLGVQIFFVLSGFIITRLLLREKAKSGEISLPRFWLRRALRILPPLALYLAFISVMNALGVLHISTLSQVGSLFFFRNHLTPNDWFNAHYWSLSVEEQFYLVWPLAVAFLKASTLRRIAWAVMVISLISRAILHQQLLEADAWRWLPMHADALMAGALAAMWMQEHEGVVLRPLSVSKQMLHGAALIITLLLCRAASTRYAWVFNPPQGTAVAVLTAIWIVRLVSLREGRFFQLLNSRPLVYLGLVSYSVYLWQQFFTAPANRWPNDVSPWWAHFPLNLLLPVIAGSLCYWLVECPCQRLRKRWESLLGMKTAAAQT